MKSNFMIKMVGSGMNMLVKKGINNKETMKAIKQEYKEIMNRASDIGKDNFLLNSYCLAGYFIAMNRKDGLSPDENYKIMENAMKNSKLFKKMMGDSKAYFSDKKMEKRTEWARLSKLGRYENEWVLDFLRGEEYADGDKDFVFGFDYTQCGVCKLCEDEKCFELAKYLCKLDFLTADLMGIKLKRTTTLAEGGEKCDFRFCRK